MSFFKWSNRSRFILEGIQNLGNKSIFPYDWFDHPDKMQTTGLPPYEAFYCKLPSCNPLETEYTDYVNLMKSGLTTEQAVVKLKLSKPHPTGIENCQYLQQIWKQEQKSSFKDLLRWYNNKDDVPTLDAMQKTIVFYHDINIDMLKLGCTLPKLAKICLHKSTDAKLCQITEGDKDLLEKFEKMLLVADLSFLHAKQLLMEPLSESLQTYANILLGLTPANNMPTRCVNPCRPVFIRVRISIQKRVDSHLDKTKPAALKIWSCLISNEQDLNVKVKDSLQQADRKKVTASVMMGFVLIATLYLKPWVAFITSVPAESCVLLSLKRIFNVVARTESIETTLCTRERLQGYFIVGVRIVETVQNNQYCETTYPRTISLQTSTCN